MTESSRRDRILRAALREFSERGLSGARTAAVADSAGVNKQLIFYYFGSKAGLYRAVLEDYLLAPILALAPPGPEGPPGERIRAVLEAFLHSLGRRPELTALLVRAVAEAGEGREAVATALGNLERVLASIVTAGQAHGYVRDDSDPRAFAAQVVSLLLGYIVREGADTEAGPSPERRARWIEEIDDLSARALRW